MGSVSLGGRGGNMKFDRNQQLDDIVVDATHKLFESLDRPAFYEGPRETDAIHSIDGAVASILGFTGTKIRGALTLVSARRVIGECLPSDEAGASSSEFLIRDWAGELVNRLLGRIKNQLLLRGLDFRVAIPITMHAEALRVPPLDTGNGPWHEFSRSEGRLWVRLALQSERSFYLPSLIPASDQLPEEGELLLF